MIRQGNLTVIDPHIMSETDFLKALGRGEWSPPDGRGKGEKKEDPLRGRALRALARARQALARSRRRRNEALRGLVQLEAELRALRAAGRPEGPARLPARPSPAEEAERQRAQELEKELATAQEAVANLMQRVALERRRGKAALITDRRARSRPPPTGAGADARRRQALETDLAAEQEAVANLLDRILAERRRWKASLLFVRRRLLKALRHPSPEAVKRLASVEAELEQSREACANLMVQLSAQKRSGQARLTSMERRARKDRRGAASTQKKAPEPRTAQPTAEPLYPVRLALSPPAPVEATPQPPAPVRPVVANASALGESLRRLAEAPAEETREPAPVAEASRSQARGVILATLAAAPPRPSSGDLMTAVVRRLSTWETAFRAKRFTIVPPDGPKWPTALFEGSVLQTMLDELLSFLLARMPRAGTLVVKGGRAEGGGVAVEFVCGGAPPAAEPGAAESGLAQVRVLASAWGGGLDITAGARGRGTHIRLRLAGD